jgi:ATP/maltotriose-dependent transcriptional regulator MalT
VPTATEAVLTAGHPVRVVKALLVRTSLSQRSGDTALQQELAQRALVAARAAGEPWLVAAAEMLVSTTMLRIGRPADAATLAASAVSTFEQLGDPTLSIEARTVLLTVAELDGRVDDALTSAQRIVELADSLGVPGYRQWALSRRAFVHHALGDLEAADAGHAASLAVGRSRWGNALACPGRGLVARARRALDESRAYLDVAVDVYDDFGAVAEGALARTLAAWVELDRGDVSAARRLGEAAVADIEVAGDAGIAALTSELLAACSVHEGDLEAGRSLLQARVPVGVPAGQGLWLLSRPDSDRVRAAVDGSALAGGAGG